ncbi:MAG: hypothetical protein KDC80_08815, partial [Saprospiraceae bacterium]|nr:hypothetical protein [Saprospiraceae bacterium]
CQSFDHPDVAEVGNDINATDKWQSFLAAVKANPDAMSDGCIMYFLLRKGEKLYTCRFHIKDESTRKRYLLENDTRLMTLKYLHRDFIAPPDFKNNINQLSIKDLSEILSASEHRIYDYSDNYIIRDFDFYFADNLTRPLDRKKLLKKLTQDQYLSKSLVLITRVSEDQKYAIMLDDAEISPFTYNTWDDYFRQPVDLPLPERSIDEQISLKWHALTIESPRDFRYLGNFRFNADNKLTEAELEHMIRTVPMLEINDRKIDQFSIRFKYVDHEYLPFSCQFNFDQGKLIAGEEFKVAIMDRLKPDDFITTFEVTTEGRILLRSSNIKIR